MEIGPGRRYEEDDTIVLDEVDLPEYLKKAPTRAEWVGLAAAHVRMKAEEREESAERERERQRGPFRPYLQSNPMELPSDVELRQRVLFERMEQLETIPANAREKMVKLFMEDLKRQLRGES